MKPTLLMVDDEPELLDLLTTLFESEGFDIISTSDITKAWDVITSRNIDVVLSDHSMPGGDGLQLLERIRKRVGSPQPAFFLMTGHMGDAVSEKSTEGVSGVFSKPMDIDNTITIIKNHFKGH